MSKPRLLVPISLQFSVRYLLRSGLLSKIADFAEPVILLGWKDESLERELEQQGFETHFLIKAEWGPEYERVRSLMNMWHQQRFNSPSTPIRERRLNLDRPVRLRAKRALRKAEQAIVLTIVGSHRIQRRELALFWSDTNARASEHHLRQLKIDAVFCVTPFLADEELAVRVSSLLGVPSCTAILSFDNLTTRSWIPIQFDQYFLWNRYNVEQLWRGYPQTRNSGVKVVGSPQFDFYWKPEYLWDEREWRRRLLLPSDRPVLLFAGGYFTCAPHEPHFLEQLDEAIETNQVPGKPIILFRRHPVDPLERWQTVLRHARHVIVDSPWKLGTAILGHTDIRSEDIEKLASTLHHSCVHVNVASTMTIDGAIFDKPQVGPAYDDSPLRKYDRSASECYQQEHYLPIAHSGGVAITHSRDEMIQAVRDGLNNPARLREGRLRLVEEICTFADGKCTERVASAVRSFVGKYMSQSSEGSAVYALRPANWSV